MPFRNLNNIMKSDKQSIEIQKWYMCIIEGDYLRGYVMHKMKLKLNFIRFHKIPHHEK
jgi:hypothetical protein